MSRTSQAVAFINDSSDRIILSATVVAELFAGVKGSAEQGTLEEFVSLFRVVPVNAEIAKSGGLYKSEFDKSHGVGLADAILAAAVEAENHPPDFALPEGIAGHSSFRNTANRQNHFSKDGVGKAPRRSLL